MSCPARATAPGPSRDAERLTNGDLMAFAEKINHPPRRMSGKPCSVQLFIDELAEKNPAEKTGFEELLASQKSGAAIWHSIVEESAEHGYTTQVGKQTVNRHRSGACRCFQ